MKKYDLAVVIGRFQPLHFGHEALIDKAASMADRVLVLVGSSYRARDHKNPLLFNERAAIIRENFSHLVGADALSIRPLVDDLYDNASWLTQVQGHIRNQTDKNNVVIVGHKKADTDYLDWFPQYTVQQENTDIDIDATRIRERFYREGIWTGQWLSMPTLKRLKNYESEFLTAQQEFLFVEKYKEPYKKLPYDVQHQTVDAVVVCLGHVLMIKRRAMPGKGLWAMPGGFLNANEQILTATVRELQEETGLKLSVNDIQFTQFFDHPRRSLRGRTITHASYFSISGGKSLPKVKGNDDAEKAKWIPLAELTNMGEQIFEDHKSIINHMIRRAKK